MCLILQCPREPNFCTYIIIMIIWFIHVRCTGHGLRALERERERYVHVYCNIAIATLYHCHFILRIQHLVHHMSSCTAPAIVWTIRIYLLYLFIWYGKVFDFICYLCILESSAVFKSPSTHPCTPATHISTQPPNHQSQRFVVFPSFLS